MEQSEGFQKKGGGGVKAEGRGCFMEKRGAESKREKEGILKKGEKMAAPCTGPKHESW